jgi:hypothetical protein
VIAGEDFASGHLFRGVVTVTAKVQIVTDPGVLQRTPVMIGFHPLALGGSAWNAEPRHRGTPRRAGLRAVGWLRLGGLRLLGGFSTAAAEVGRHAICAFTPDCVTARGGPRAVVCERDGLVDRVIPDDVAEPV